MKKFIPAAVLFISIILMTACYKTPDAAPQPDWRDKLVGQYEVWDTSYKYIDIDSSGKPIYEKVGVFHYTKAGIAKNRVTFYTNLGYDERDGLTYTIMERDSSITGKNGEREGFLGHEINFVMGSSAPVSITDANDKMFGCEGELKADTLYLRAGEYMGGYSSGIALKIK